MLVDAEFDEERTGPRIERSASGAFAVSGPMTFESVPELAREGAGVLVGGENVELDLGRVTRTDSAGLALLVEWIRLARSHGATVELRNVPEQMLAIAQTSNLENLLVRR